MEGYDISTPAILMQYYKQRKYMGIDLIWVSLSFIIYKKKKGFHTTDHVSFCWKGMIGVPNSFFGTNLIINGDYPEFADYESK